MFSFIDFNMPDIFGSNTMRGTRRSSHRGFDPWNIFEYEHEPTFFYNKQGTSNNKRVLVFDDDDDECDKYQDVRVKTPRRNPRSSIRMNRRSHNDDDIDEETKMPKAVNKTRKELKNKVQLKRQRQFHKEEAAKQKAQQNRRAKNKLQNEITVKQRRDTVIIEDVTPKHSIRSSVELPQSGLIIEEVGSK